jgi:hypothetical protein
LPFSESPIFRLPRQADIPTLHGQDDVVAFEPEFEEVVKVERIDNGGRLQTPLLNRSELAGACSAEPSSLTCWRAGSRPDPAAHAS